MPGAPDFVTLFLIIRHLQLFKIQNFDENCVTDAPKLMLEYNFMALRSCRECKKKVSTEAKICPRCGVPDPTALKRKIKSKQTLKGTGAGGWSKEHLKAQAELHGSSDENEVNRYVESSDWDRFTKNKVKNVWAHCQTSFCSNKNKLYRIALTSVGSRVCSLCKEYLIEEGDKSLRAGVTKNKVNYKSETKGFWTGSEGLAKTFWLYFIGGNIVGNILLTFAGNEGTGMITFVVIAIVCWTIAATIGIFNAADIYKAEKISSGQTYGYATAAKVATVLIILSALGQALNS